MKNEPKNKSKIVRNCIIAGFLIGLFFGNGIGIAGSFGAVNGGLVVGLIGAYIGFRVGQFLKKRTSTSKTVSTHTNVADELEALRGQIKKMQNKK